MGSIQHAIDDDYIPQGTSFPPPSFQPKMVQPAPMIKPTPSTEFSADQPYMPQGDSYPPPNAFEGDMEDEWRGPRTTSSNSQESVDRDSIRFLKREVISTADEAGQEIVRAEAERLRYGDPAALYGAICANPFMQVSGRLSREILSQKPVGCASSKRPHPRNYTLTTNHQPPTTSHQPPLNCQSETRVEG